MSTKPVIYRGHVGEHLTEVCEECHNFQQGWSATAEKVNTLTGVVNRLRTTAGSLFSTARSHEQEELAKYVRRLADQFDEDRGKAIKELDVFIHRREKATD